MASSILVEKKRFFPRQASTTSFNPGWKKAEKKEQLWLMQYISLLGHTEQ